MEKDEEKSGAEPCFLFAEMDKEGRSVCAEDFHRLTPPSLGQAEGEWQHCREGAGAGPSEGQPKCRRQGISCSTFLKTGYFCQTRNLPKAMEKNFQMKQKRRLG